VVVVRNQVAAVQVVSSDYRVNLWLLQITQ
jgi:hypothetical protein